jgi:chaperonin GroEL (HSP60 family)
MIDDFELFEGKSFKDLCEDIYDRSEKKKDQLELLISELRPLVRNIEDAIQIVPQIQKYLEISVKNDEQLVKLAAIGQRLQATKIEKSGDGLLSEEEKDALWKEVQEVQHEVRALPVNVISSSIELLK